MVKYVIILSFLLAYPSIGFTQIIDRTFASHLHIVQSITKNSSNISLIEKKAINGCIDSSLVKRNANFTIKSIKGFESITYVDNGYPSGFMKIRIYKNDTLDIWYKYKESGLSNFVFYDSIALYSFATKKRQYLILSGGSVHDFHHRENSELTYYLIIDISNHSKTKWCLLGNIGGVETIGDFNNDGIVDILAITKLNYSEDILKYNIVPKSFSRNMEYKQFNYKGRTNFFINFIKKDDYTYKVQEGNWFYPLKKM